MKLYIRFLRQGLIEAEAPEQFDTLTPEERMEWATEYLENCTDHQIVIAMADYDPNPIWTLSDLCSSNDFFDSAPQAEAIELPLGEYNDPRTLVMTKAWTVFAFHPDCRELIIPEEE